MDSDKLIEHGGYKIVHDGSFGMYTIKPLSRGSTPKELKGRYTSYGAAKAAIDASNKGRKGKTNGEAESGS
tara:strand:- start:275 stop:487 length:213 start_codon:yes stop_codon:yes gene_type:complete